MRLYPDYMRIKVIETGSVYSVLPFSLCNKAYEFGFRQIVLAALIVTLVHVVLNTMNIVKSNTTMAIPQWQLNCHKLLFHSSVNVSFGKKRKKGEWQRARCSF